MATVLLTLLIALLVFGAMSIGLMFGRAPIKGSCGGLGAGVAGDGVCGVCGGNPAKCPEGGDPRNSSPVR
jgi:hypothetical protein